MQEYIAMWKNYTNFSGKATRSEYALAFLLHIVITYVLIVTVVLLQSPLLNTFASVYGFVIVIPTLSLAIRRLRDAGMSWLWALAFPVPLVGIAVVVLLACKESA